MKLFHDRCINSTNKVKGFWNFLKGKRESIFPSQLMNPENKSETFTKGKDINSVHFNSFGKESSIDLKLKKEIEDFISNVNNNEVSLNSPILVKFSKEQIGKIVNRLHTGKSSGIDEIPNEFLKFGGELLVNSLVDLFTIISDL